MKASLCRYFVLLLILAVLSSCLPVLHTKHEGVAPIPAELTQQTYLYEVVRHLYRWYLDEAEIEQMMGFNNFIFWVRPLDVPLDSGDHSVLAEILLPQLNISIKVKKAEYLIQETGVAVKSRGFRITQINRERISAARRISFQTIELDFKQMRDYLYRTRNQQDFPDEAMIEYLRQAVRKQMAKEETLSSVNLPAGERIVHLAPLSPVANETWVFWEDGRKLVYFASDIDLENPAVWEHQVMMARIFDLEQQVVVSLQEVPGSNRFLTRSQIGRAMFNCVILGRRITITPPEDGFK